MVLVDHADDVTVQEIEDKTEASFTVAINRNSTRKTA
jgi:acyl CoA:acetate/3-ketoacid CoA transferase beta subunit